MSLQTLSYPNGKLQTSRRPRQGLSGRDAIGNSRACSRLRTRWAPTRPRTARARCATRRPRNGGCPRRWFRTPTTTVSPKKSWSRPSCRRGPPQSGSSSHNCSTPCHADLDPNLVGLLLGCTALAADLQPKETFGRSLLTRRRDLKGEAAEPLRRGRQSSGSEISWTQCDCTAPMLICLWYRRSRPKSAPRTSSAGKRGGRGRKRKG